MDRRDLIKTIAVISPGLFIKSPLLALNKTVQSFNEKIWFNYPGKYWNSQSIHIGNGSLGLSFLGGVSEEIFSITEKTLWTGGPGEYKDYHYGIVPGGKEHLSKIRELTLSNKIENLKEADNLIKSSFLGDDKGYGHFSAFGRLSILFNHTNEQKYTRSLDLTTAIANVQYEIDGIGYKREYYCSYPDKVAVFNFSSTAKKKISFTLKWNVFQEDHQIILKDNILQLSGKVNGNNRNFCLADRYINGYIRTNSRNVIIL